MINGLLSDVSSYVSDKVSASSLTSENYIGVDNMTPNRGGVRHSEYVPETGLATKFEKGDILIGNIRPYFKKIWLAEFDGGCSPDVLVIRTHKGISSQFLYALLSTDNFFDYDMKGAKGSKMPRGDKDHIMRYKVSIPDSQGEIGAFIVNLNEKIANNNSICADLEGMAKLLYDYWFVQFDFPDENGKPYKSSGGKMVWNEELKREIPAGWMAKALPDASSVRYGFPLSTELFSNEGAPVIRIRDILDTSISAYTSEKVSDDYLTNIGDLLIGMDGNFQMNYWSRTGDIVNQRITRIRKTELPIMLIRFQIEPFIIAKVTSVARSTVGHLGDSDIKGLKVVVPNGNVDYSFFENAINMICSLRNENRDLASLRDFLLPMLMNGQVKVKETIA